MRSKTFVTGATGFLGRELVRTLLAAGRPVVALVRESTGDRCAARSRLLRALGSGPDVPDLEVVVGDLLDPDLLSRVAPAGPFGEVWHLAALVDLGKRRPAVVERVNAGGTAAVLDLSLRSGVRRFHFVGTAYVGGLSAAPVPEGPLPEPVLHRNAYERSKYDAERLVRIAAHAGLAVTIYRPSIVVGDSRTGQAAPGGAFYDLVRLCLLARGLPDFVLPGCAESRVDLVPVDRVVAALLTLSIRADSVGETFNLVSPDPPTVAELVELGRRVLGLPIAEVRDVAPELLPWPGRAVFAAASPILTYLGKGPRFRRERSAVALGEDFLSGEGGARRWLARVLDAAREDRFGRTPERLAREEDRLLRRIRREADRRPVAI